MCRQNEHSNKVHTQTTLPWSLLSPYGPPTCCIEDMTHFTICCSSAGIAISRPGDLDLLEQLGSPSPDHSPSLATSTSQNGLFKSSHLLSTTTIQGYLLYPQENHPLFAVLQPRFDDGAMDCGCGYERPRSSPVSHPYWFWHLPAV